MPVARIKEDDFVARNKALADEMNTETNRDCGNLTVLRVKYLRFCQALFSDPNARINQLFICARTQAQSCPIPGVR
jgi:hypothetical protein